MCRWNMRGMYWVGREGRHWDVEADQGKGIDRSIAVGVGGIGRIG